MEALLTIILFAVAGYYLLAYLGRRLLRSWLRRKQEEFAAGGGNPFFGFGGAAGPSERPGRSRPEGQVTIRQERRAEKKVRGNVGEYVSYEEVEEVREEKTADKPQS